MPVSAADLDRLAEGRTVATVFRDTVEAVPDAVALRGRRPDGEWASWTWREYADTACRLAGALRGAGVQPGDRVVLMLRNRPEFHLLDTAVLLCGATPISVYNSSSPEQIAYVVGHCRAVLAVVDDVEMLERFLKVRDELPALSSLAVVDDPDGLADPSVLRYADLAAGQPVDLAEAASVPRPDDLVTVIYTSGTTGPPKGVTLTHRNAVWTSESYRDLTGDLQGLRTVSYLPMAHIAERMASHYLGIGARLEIWSCADPTQLADHLRDCRPQTLFGVPRVWEKLSAGVRGALAADPEREKQFHSAVEGGKALDAARLAGGLSPEQEQMAAMLEEKAFLPVRSLLGLDQVQIAVTGAAPIPADVIRWFRAIGVPLSEIYGMSESTGPITWDPYEVRPGTVGRALPGVEVRLADDGEVVFRGGNATGGYLDDPDKTAELIGDDGWLHTGDIGQIDEDGYLSIVDRKKEIIITAGGKNISPANLEAILKSFPLIGQAAVIGDNRPYLTALLVLDPDVAPAWARSQGIAETDVAALARDPQVLAEVERSVTEANAQVSKVESIKKFRLLETEWMPDSDELTPTMKLKRRGISARYAEQIESLYS
jgi:long-chain acyl-CoA synthetase